MTNDRPIELGTVGRSTHHRGPGFATRAVVDTYCGVDDHAVDRFPFRRQSACCILDKVILRICLTGVPCLEFAKCVTGQWLRG
jgi:hypothetical protein